MRRLPAYILIQTSGAMRGEPIEAINSGLNTLISALRQDPYTFETMWVSVITFNRHPELILPLSELTTMRIPVIDQPEVAGSHLGEALEFICKKIDSEVVKPTATTKGDWKPILFIMCDGRVNDISVFKRIVPTIKQVSYRSSIGVFLIGNKATDENVKQFTDNIVTVSDDIKLFTRRIWDWVEADVCVPSDTLHDDSIILPPPPLEINKII